MRSLLFVPGDSERKLAKCLSSGADALIVDLEDSVAPQNKQLARDTAANFLTSCRDRTGPAIFVRVNDLSTGLLDDDLKYIMSAGPDGIMLPKSDGGHHVQQLSAKLRVLEAEHGLPDGKTKIIPLITETAIGVLSAASYRGASGRLAGLTWGAEDLAAAVGARENRDESGAYTDLFRFARTITLLAASSADLEAIDTVFVNFRDPDAFRRECAEAERDGFTAKLAIHPDQVPMINAAFTPSTESVDHARRLVEAFVRAGNPGVVSIDGRMFDIPHLRRARRLLSRAEALAG